MSAIDNVTTASANSPVLATVKHRGGTSRIKTETASGAAWLRTYLHPPSSLENGRPGYCGFPDRNSAPTAKLHCRGQLEDRLTQAITGNPADKFLQLFMFGLNRLNASWQFDPTGELVQSNELVSDNSTYDVVGNAVKDISKLRRNYGSVTIYQDETAFSNRGTITCGSFRPDIVHINTLSALRGLLDEAERRAGKQLPRLRKHIADAIKGKKKDEDWEELDPIGASITSTAYILIDRMPHNASDVQNLDSKSYTGMLRDGAFIINRLAEDVNLFEPFLAEAINVLEISTGTVYTVSTSPDWVTDQFMMTFVSYENLSANSGEIVTSGNHIFQKWYNGYEVAPTTRSSLLPFMDDSAIEDEMALKLANNLMHSCPTADVAATNSLATLLMSAISAAPKVIEWIGNIFGKKTPAPVPFIIPPTAYPPAVVPSAPPMPPSVAPQVTRLGKGVKTINGYTTISTARVNRRVRQQKALAKIANATPTPPAPNKKARRAIARARNQPITLREYNRIPAGLRP
nr:MAG: putative structural protein [Sichuan hepe-like virus 4]